MPVCPGMADRSGRGPAEVQTLLGGWGGGVAEDFLEEGAIKSAKD